MMREVLDGADMTDSHARLIGEAPQTELSGAPVAADQDCWLAGISAPAISSRRKRCDRLESPWPDLVLIDGGQGQLTLGDRAH